MSRIRVIDCSSEALARIGQFCTPMEGPAVAAGQEHSFIVAADELGLAAPLCAGRLECGTRPLRLSKLERHLRTPEFLSAVEGDAVVCAAPPQEPRGGKLADIRAILVRKGQAVVLATGAWHWIPYPLQKGGCRFLVVFRRGTGDDDLHFCELSESVEIDTGGAI
jgi:ureidoglycolate hydrolase